MTTTGTFHCTSTNDPQFTEGHDYTLTLVASSTVSATSIVGTTPPPAEETDTPSGDGGVTEGDETPGDAPDSPPEPTTLATP